MTQQLVQLGGPVVVLVLLAFGLCLIWRLLTKQSFRGNLVIARQLLSGNETEFFHRLRRALPDYEVLPQVSMAALLEVNLPDEDTRYWAVRRLFAMKVVDYVICRGPGLQVIAVIELDDRTHDGKRQKDESRDAMLKSAGIPTIRWDSRAKPTQRDIAARVASLSETTFL